ncbi:MAG: formylglycine-generating enzyme family protein [Symploca sp. SIO2E6]|nr:formylglycine-generating enzyme family protein [Symploca sp. SIO2E6]
MMRSAEERPANTQVILQRLDEIDQILNSPPKPPKVPTTVPSSPQRQPTISGSGSGGLTRRQLINAAGLGALVVVGGVIVYPTLTSPRTKINWNDLPPAIAGKELQSLDFDVVTVDSFGKENSRNSSQAQFFAEDLGNGIMLEMVAIPGGTFMMGSPDTEKGRSDDESPHHSVKIKPFYLSKFTVTQAQWKAVAALAKVSRDLDVAPAYFKGDNLPVELVSWHDSKEYCARLSRKTGRVYRLPSEAEWEYACRAGTTTPFHFGETITADLANYNGDYTYGFGPEGGYRKKTTPVGSFQVANDFGLYDMHGNVWEWCEDHLHENYQGAPKDGSSWLNRSGNDNPSRMLRGGSWDDNPLACRSALRHDIKSNFRGNDLGFRVVCSAALPFLALYPIVL